MVKRIDEESPVLGQKLAAAIKKAAKADAGKAKKPAAKPRGVSITPTPRNPTASVRIRIPVLKNVTELGTTTPKPVVAAVAAVHKQAFDELQVSMEGLDKELEQGQKATESVVIDLPIPKFLPPKSEQGNLLEEVVLKKAEVINEPTIETKSENQDEVLKNLNKAIDKRVQANKAKATFRNVLFKGLAVVGAVAAIVVGADLARK